MYSPSDIARLTVKGSLKNTADGFEFSLKNTIDSGMIAGFGPIIVGDKRYEGAAITLDVEGKRWQADQLNWRNMASVPWGAVLRVLVQGDPLPPGPATISVTANVTDIGRATFDLHDEVSEG